MGVVSIKGGRSRQGSGDYGALEEHLRIVGGPARGDKRGEPRENREREEEGERDPALAFREGLWPDQTQGFLLRSLSEPT